MRKMNMKAKGKQRGSKSRNTKQQRMTYKKEANAAPKWLSINRKCSQYQSSGDITRPMDSTQKEWKAWIILRHGDSATNNYYLSF